MLSPSCKKSNHCWFEIKRKQVSKFSHWFDFYLCLISFTSKQLIICWFPTRSVLSHIFPLKFVIGCLQVVPTIQKHHRIRRAFHLFDLQWNCDDLIQTCNRLSHTKNRPLQPSANRIDVSPLAETHLDAENLPIFFYFKWKKKIIIRNPFHGINQFLHVFFYVFCIERKNLINDVIVMHMTFLWLVDSKQNNNSENNKIYYDGTSAPQQWHKWYKVWSA